jgi:hypothetical protein
MYRLLISLFEFGQFLRILLWISVPMIVVSMLVTTWLHYRRKRQLPEELLLSLQGAEGARGMARPFLLRSAGEIAGNGQQPLEQPPSGDEGTMGPEEKENIYKGILWMKEKYEQYRDMADRRHEELKEQLARAEKRYQDLLESRGLPAVSAARAADASLAADASHMTDASHTADTTLAADASPVANASHTMDASPTADTTPTADTELPDVERASYPALLEEKNRQIAYLQQQLDQRIKSYYQSELEGRENKSQMLQLEEGLLRTRYLLEEKQAYVDQLEGQLVSERRKIEELVVKLQASSKQLLTIYEELDQSMKAPNPGEPLGSVDGLLNSSSET